TVIVSPLVRARERSANFRSLPIESSYLIYIFVNKSASRLPCLHYIDERPDWNSTNRSKKFCVFRRSDVTTD
ncbi:MAG: hypothetical protein ABSF22_10410, partial [Bryobacteraceae bacterium]